MTSTAPFTWLGPKVAIGGVAAYTEDLSPFTFKMNCAFELFAQDAKGRGRIIVDSRWDPRAEERKDTFSKYQVLHARLDDSPYVEPQVPEILRAANIVAQAIRQGDTVLVTCAAGRNRSGVVLCEALVLCGHPVEQAIAHIQAKRLHALSNEAFVKWLRRKRQHQAF